MVAATLLGGTYLLSRGTEREPEATGVAGAASETSASTTASSAATTGTTALPEVAPTDRFTIAPGGSAVVGSGGRLHTYTVEVEDGIPVDPAAFAAAVDATLADPRGWTHPGDVRLQRVGPAASPRIRVRLATPATVDAHCAPLETNGELSCRNGTDVMVNIRRWSLGAAASTMPLEDYRHYVISHEVGHALGHHHEPCPAPDALAPVMLQQTKGLEGCRPNPWPYPDAT